jgi:energy-coupling factor transporter transmembrane protein EcfT
MGIRIIEKNKEKPFKLWLPGILIFFFLFLFMILLIIPIVIVLIGLLIWNLIPGQGKIARAYTRILFSVPKIFWAMRGLSVDVESKDTIVKIKF